MKTRVLLSTVVIVSLGAVVMLSQLHRSGAGFAGPSFHNKDQAVIAEVEDRLEQYLIRRGFRFLKSFEFSEKQYGVLGENMLFFKKSPSRFETIRVRMFSDARAVRTHIQWKHIGFSYAANDCEKRSLKFGLELDSWFRKLEYESYLPERLQQKTTEWFREELAKVTTN